MFSFGRVRVSLVAVLSVLTLAMSGASASASGRIRRCPVHRSTAEEDLELPFVATVRTSNTPCGQVVGPDNDLEDGEGNQYEALVNLVQRWKLPRHFRVSVEVDEGVSEHWKCTSRQYYTRSGLEANTDLGDVYGHKTVCIRTHQWVEVTTANEP